MEQENNKIPFVLLHKGNEYYVLAGKDGSITSRENEEKLALEYTAQLELCYRRGQEAAATAHYLEYMPRVLSLTIEDISDRFFDLEKGIELIKFGTVGEMHGLKCNSGKDISAFYKNATSINARLE